MFNHTRVYLNTRIRKTQHDRIMYRVPVPQENEKIFFNQESVQASVSVNATTKRTKIASIHITSKRLILLAQSSSIGPPSNSEYFDTFEVDLSQFRSLKTTQPKKKVLHFDIVLKRQDQVGIDITFENKKDASRSESLVEYLKMATSTIITSNQQPERQIWAQDDTLPTYLEAIQPQHSFDILPPAYN